MNNFVHILLCFSQIYLVSVEIWRILLSKFKYCCRSALMKTDVRSLCDIAAHQQRDLGKTNADMISTNERYARINVNCERTGVRWKATADKKKLLHNEMKWICHIFASLSWTWPVTGRKGGSDHWKNVTIPMLMVVFEWMRIPKKKKGS